MFLELAQATVDAPIPAEIFNWVVGTGALIIGGMAAAIIALWFKLNGGAGLTQHQNTMLRELHESRVKGKRLDDEQTARREDAVTFLREHKDIMVEAFEMTTKVGQQCESSAQAVLKLLEYMEEE